MKKNTFFNFIILITIFIISRSSIFNSKWVAIGLAVILLIMHIINGKSINSKIVYIILTWIGINLFAAIITGSQLVILRVLNNSVSLLLLPYLTLNIIGISFWYRFEKIIYILTLISIPIFLTHLMFPEYFHNLIHIFRPITSNIYYIGDPDSTYWSALIYVNSISLGVISPMRNSGFMWEPGAFAMVIIWAIVYNWITKGIKFDKRFFVYAIAMATTLSTAGYLAFFIVILAFYIRKVNFKNAVMLIIVIVIFVLYIFKLYFVGGEINWYLENYQSRHLSYNKYYEAVKVSRFEIIDYDVEKVLKHPFGYGVIAKKDYSNKVDIIGTNGLTSLLKMWGIPIFIFIIFLIWRYLNLFNRNLYNKQTILFLLTGIMITFFSNPIQRNCFFYLIVLTPLIFKDLKFKT